MKTYMLSKDKKGLRKQLKDGGYYHIHSNELTKQEKHIHKILKQCPAMTILELHP